MTQRIIRTDSDGLCTLTLNRPDKLNALDTATFAELDAILESLEAETETVGCVVMRGSGRGFCAGADLGAIDTTLGDYKPRIIDRLARLPQPTIAAIHGVCLTGGLELVLACDFIIADETARFADTHGKWGLVGAWGMIQRLPRRIGAAAARGMMLTSRMVGAAEAKAMGLIDVLAGPEGLDAALADLTGSILANSWYTNRHTKRIMLETDGMPLDQALIRERETYPGFAPDYNERVASFTKK